MVSHYIDKYVNSFTNKNITEKINVKYSISMILIVLLASSWGNHSINSKAINPDADTIFYRINPTIRQMENQLWAQGLDFLKRKRKKLSGMKCYIAIDETYDSYTGKLFRKEKQKKKLTTKEKETLKYIHKYKPNKGDTGSYKYLVIAIIYGNTRRVLRVKAIKRKENYKVFIIKTLIQLKKEVKYECALFDRGFFDGKFAANLKQNDIPFIIRARITKQMKKLYDFPSTWKKYKDHAVGKEKSKIDLVLGADITQGKRTKWAFLTNMEVKNLQRIREIYRKRWNIENIFKATDGIQLRVQTNNQTTRFFCVCLSFLFYNAWQNNNKRGYIILIEFIKLMLEKLMRIISKTILFFRDKLKINLPFWNKIISSF